jgi:hypothetical protein
MDEPTLAAAGRLEVLLDEAFPDDAAVQDVVVALATFRPEGGYLLFDADSIRPLMRRLETRLGLKL